MYVIIMYVLSLNKSFVVFILFGCYKDKERYNFKRILDR